MKLLLPVTFIVLLGCNDTNSSPACGDGILQEIEQCDGDLLFTSCEAEGFVRGGQLKCSQDCELIFTDCDSSYCGDGIIQPGVEECDGQESITETCASMGFYASGTLHCRPGTCMLDYSACERCGDGVVQAEYGEECDGDQLGDNTCRTLGFYAGTLYCSPQCQYDTRECSESGKCGDGITQVWWAETCDGTDVHEYACDDVGLPGPSEVTCSDDCSINYEAECYPFAYFDKGENSNIVIDNLGSIVIAERTPGYDSDVSIKKISSGLSLVWETIINTPEPDLFYDHDVDSNGNIYIAFSTRGTVFGHESDGSTNGVLAKLGPGGNYLWSISFTTSLRDDLRSVTVLPNDHIAVAGLTEGQLQTNAIAPNDNIFAALISSDGTVVWTKQWGAPTGALWDRRIQMLESNGNIFIAGSTSGPIGSSSDPDVHSPFLSKITSDGTIIWVKIFEGSLVQYARNISADQFGNVYFSNYVDQCVSHNSKDDLFIQKISSDGTPLWNLCLGGMQDDYGNGMHIDPTSQILWIGYKNGGNSTGADGNIALARVDLNGNVLSEQYYGTMYGETVDGVSSYGNKLYILGQTWGDFFNTTQTDGREYILTTEIEN